MTLPYLSQAAEDAGRFATVDSATWLAQTDAEVRVEFDELVEARDFEAAYDLLGAHLARTEANRRRVHGPPPDLATVFAGFAAQLVVEQTTSLLFRVEQGRRAQAAALGCAS